MNSVKQPSNLDSRSGTDNRLLSPATRRGGWITLWRGKFGEWRVRNIPDGVFLFLLSLTVGVLTGVAAYTFKYLIAEISGFFIPHIREDCINWWIIIPPVAGILLTGIFTRYIVRTNLTHGVSQLISHLKKKTYRLRSNITFSPILGGVMTLGCGGSSGVAGPIAYAGAAIGSNVGRALGLDPGMLKTLIGCGTAAGITGVFMAPFGGFLYTIELLRMKLSVKSLIAAATACLISFLTAYSCNGFKLYIPDGTSPAFDVAILPSVLVLGILCGFYCIYYSKVMSLMDTFFRKIKNPWVRNVTGGLILGMILFVFPSMFSTGNGVMRGLLNGDFSVITDGCLLSHFDHAGNVVIIAAALILACKCWAVSSTNSSGGVGGDFAPTLFAGSIAGFLFATLCNQWLGTSLDEGVFALIGMSGVMAGAIEAPMMAIFIVMESTRNYEYALPLAICALISFSVVKCHHWIFVGHNLLILHHHWFAPGSPEPTVNSTK